MIFMLTDINQGKEGNQEKGTRKKTTIWSMKQKEKRKEDREQKNKA